MRKIIVSAWIISSSEVDNNLKLKLTRIPNISRIPNSPNNSQISIFHSILVKKTKILIARRIILGSVLPSKVRAAKRDLRETRERAEREQRESRERPERDLRET